MFGLSHRLLVIDATHKSFDIEPISDEVLKRTLGGKGLATDLLLQHNPQQVDPLSPENHLIFAIGPLIGTAIWGSCRYGVYTKSPQTGYYSESYSGGKAAEYMAAAGFDAVMIYGASADPVWVEISEDAVYFHSAVGLLGRETYETEDHVKAWVKTNRSDARNCAALVIGPGAENGVTFSVVENDYWRSAGRTGVGTVVGSKKIKAIAFWGRREKEVADPDLLKGVSQETARGGRENAGVKAYKSLGTPMMVDIMSNVGSFPTRYWSKGTADHREKINATALHKRCDVQPRAFETVSELDFGLAICQEVYYKERNSITARPSWANGSGPITNRS